VGNPNAGEAVMGRLPKASGIAVFALLAFIVDAPAQPATDVNIVTGLDFSHSMTVDEHALVQEGMAQALLAPRVLGSIRSGPNGRIGFAMFGWHVSDVPLVPWTIIETEEDAKRVALQIRIEVVKGRAVEERLRKIEKRFGEPTDLSNALLIGAGMLKSAPYRSERSVLNIIGNGSDNVGEDAPSARDAVVQMGITVNGVVLGPDETVVGYFRRSVVGGANSFVMYAPAPDALVEVFERKLLSDIVVGCVCGSDPDR
jgi:hypothetical protein